MNKGQKKFSWPRFPENDAGFEVFVRAMDAAMAERGLPPSERRHRCVELLWEALGWGGDVFPKPELADQPGFQGQVLLAKVYRWYDRTYASKLKRTSFAGTYAVPLGNATWRVISPIIFGQVSLCIDRDLKITNNVLCHVEGMTQAFADTLTQNELFLFFNQFIVSYETLEWQLGLPASALFEAARTDFASSTDEVLAERFGQARWAAQQALEKNLKGLLAIGQTKFPTGGRDGHNLVALGKLLRDAHGIEIPEQFLSVCNCPPSVRYATDSTEIEALNANAAVVLALHFVRVSPQFPALLQRRASGAG